MGIDFVLPKESASKLREVLAHLENTKDEEWCMDRVRTKDMKQNCLMGHVFNMGANDREANEWLDWFEYIATEYMYFPINDGQDARYRQATPKLRCIAYLNDILTGKEKSTWQLLEEDGEAHRVRTGRDAA